MKTLVACFGDSLVYGFPYGPSESWLKTVEELDNNISFINYGECGASCDDILEKLERTEFSQYVNHIIFLGGANDILENRPNKVIISDIFKAYEYSKSKNLEFAFVKIWLSGDALFNKKLKTLYGEIDKTLKEKITILDFTDALGTSLEELDNLFIDEIHPLVKTYKKIGIYGEPLIKKWLLDTNIK